MLVTDVRLVLLTTALLSMHVFSNVILANLQLNYARYFVKATSVLIPYILRYNWERSLSLPRYTALNNL